MVLCVMEDDKVVYQMRLDDASNGEGKTAQQVKKVKAKIAKAKNASVQLFRWSCWSWLQCV